jgi:hypothetical protein
LDEYVEGILCSDDVIFEQEGSKKREIKAKRKEKI